MSMVEEYSPDTKPEKEQVSPSGGCSRNAPRECWLDLGRVVGLFFIVLFHAAGNGVEFPLFFQRVPFLFMAAAYFVGRRKISTGAIPRAGMSCSIWHGTGRLFWKRSSGIGFI